jgi:DNA invertase Pin-like site-specific DNA recombinase
MLEVARKRQIDMMLVWRYDRFAQSTQALVHALRACQRLGVDSIGDQENLDTTTPPSEMICTVMVSLAQFERVLISERVKAGMPRARAQGKRISQAPIPEHVQVRMADFCKQGVSI